MVDEWQMDLNTEGALHVWLSRFLAVQMALPFAP